MEDLKFRIHFSYWEVEDYVDLEWDSIEDIREKALDFLNQRGLDFKTWNVWSEKL